MSLHDLIADDLTAVLGDVEHGFALRATLDGRPVRGFMTWEDVEAGGILTRRATFRLAESEMDEGKARSTLYGVSLTVYEPHPYGTRRYTVDSVQPEEHGEVLLILEPA